MRVRMERGAQLEGQSSEGAEGNRARVVDRTGLAPCLLKEWETLRPGDASLKYFSLIRADPDLPCPCITAGGGEAKAAVTHPHEPRKFTLDEARVLCGFPADFILEGTYAERYARLGNAVPPLMMRAIAAELRDGLFTTIGRTKRGFMDAVAREPEAPTPEKPPFRIPSMADVARARGTAGLTVASTFSGCGGSCLGFEMAGYRVLWANEFLPIARESYAANHPETILDGRDIRKVDARDILDAIGLERGELDVFNGSPPCQAFSSAGQGAKGWGTQRDYGNGVKQCNEDLFFEYVRLVEGVQPRAFVAENVSGLTRGAALGYFKLIMRGLEAAGYDVRCKVLDAQWLGVPQTRTRSIFVGVRKDLGIKPEYPKPLPYRYTLREVLPGLATAGNRTNFTRRPLYHHGLNRLDLDGPVCTLMAGTPTDYKVTDAKPLEQELYLPEGSEARRAWDANHPGQMNWALKGRLRRTEADKPVPSVLSAQGSKGGSTAAMTPPYEPRRFTIEECRILCGFPADYELKGTYSEQWARLGNAVPPLMMRAIAGALRDQVFSRLGRTAAGFVEAV